jgi:predicted AAA+ superfamily ATPase
MQGVIKPLFRYASTPIREAITEERSFLLLGPRQVGKTTILTTSLQDAPCPLLTYFLQDPAVKIELERDPSRLIREARAINGRIMVFIDEAQKIPSLFDAAQVLIDEKKATIFLTGSSARKLRRKGVNLLPGRIRLFTLDPLLWGELGCLGGGSEAPIPSLALQNINDTALAIEDTLIYGNLPGILSAPPKDAVDLLQAYARLYIEEEIRAEALSRAIGPFSRFLELAAMESGTAPSFTKLSQESGVSIPTIKGFYSILEDTMIVERVDAYIKNARKRILSSSRYYFFDIGVRNALARLPIVPELLKTQKGILFEHAVILELIRRVRLLKTNHRVYYWRTSGGAEVDCVLETHDELIPIEIKSASHVSPSDLTGLRSFIADYGENVKRAFIITMGQRLEKIDERITALPWQYL